MSAALPDRFDDLVPLVDPTALPRVLTRRDARGLGISDDVLTRRVRSGGWSRVVRGVYITAGRPTPGDLVEAAVTYGGPGSVVSGMAALSRHGMRVRFPARILVLVAAGASARSSGPVVVRQTGRLPPPDPGSPAPVASVARAVADSTQTMTRLDDVRAVVAEAVQRGLCDVDDLAAELAAARRNGSALFRQALAEVGVGARSAPEARAAALLRRAGLDGFEQNAEVRVGGRRYVADLLWRRQRAILEVDGREYHLSPDDWAATMRRDLALESAGWSVVHVRPSDLTDEDDFVTRIRTWLGNRPVFP